MSVGFYLLGLCKRVCLRVGVHSGLVCPSLVISPLWSFVITLRFADNEQTKMPLNMVVVSNSRSGQLICEQRLHRKSNSRKIRLASSRLS